MAEKNRILVLSVDRDNDIGRKTSFSGPIIGKEDLLKCANELGLKDPEDSDFNALFEAVKVHDELKKHSGVEVAAITGHENRGMEADMEIAKQLGKVLKQFQADGVLFVTDGADDEHVMPIIQSKLPIVSVRRVIVKQSERLESGYYQIKDFISETLDNPKYARLVFGLPAVALVLVALFGIEGWRIIIGALGAYLFIKGFKLEDYVGNMVGELKVSFTQRRLGFFLYIVAILVFLLATYRGYTVSLDFIHIGYFETAASYLSAAVYIYFLSFSAFWLGKNLGIRKRSGKKIIAVIIFGFALSLVVYSAADLIIKPQTTFVDFVISIVFGFILMFIAIVLERFSALEKKE